jgi:hypothetical protein
MRVWTAGHPISKPETEIDQTPMINSCSIRLGVRDLQIVGLLLGLIRGLVSHVLVLLADSVHVDSSGSLPDLWEVVAGLGG